MSDDQIVDLAVRNGVFKGDPETVMSALAAEVRRLRGAACRYYNADGTYSHLDSPEAVIEQRKAAAVELERLRAVRDAAARYVDAYANWRPGDPKPPGWSANRAYVELVQALKAAGGGE